MVPPAIHPPTQPPLLGPLLRRSRRIIHPALGKLLIRNTSNTTSDQELLLYPTCCQPDPPHQTTNSFLIDPGYIKRYRDPSRHDSYVIPDHHHPYEFRTRPNATQAPPNSQPSSPSSSSSASNARRARLNMEHSWLPSPSSWVNNNNGNHPPPTQTRTVRLSNQSHIGICFPGSSSQYLGMGSFLESSSSSSSSKEFKLTWEEAQSSLNEFQAWFQGLGLVEKFLNLGYSSQDSSLLGGPIRHSDFLSAHSATSDQRLEPAVHGLNRSLKDIVFHGPQNELSNSVNAQPAILITSMAYLRTLEVEGKIPARSLTQVYAGHSAGEYTACVASGSIDFSSGIKLTRLYGLLSARSLELNRLKPSTFSSYTVEERKEGAENVSETNESKAQMSALLINEAYYNHRSSEAPQFSSSHIKQSSERFLNLMSIIHQFNSSNPKYQVEIASFNSSNQIVLSGTRAGVLAACSRLQELEIANRAADLPCSSPFHSSFMRPASHGMKVGIESIEFKPPGRPILIAKHKLRGQETPERKVTGGTGPGLAAKIKEERHMTLPSEMVELKYVTSHEDLGELKIHLFQSIDKPVWWSETIHELLNYKQQQQGQGEGAGDREDPTVPHKPLDHLLFVGPGKALKNLCNKQIGFDRTFRTHHLNASRPQPSLNHPLHGLNGSPQTLSLATMEDFHQFVFCP